MLYNDARGDEPFLIDLDHAQYRDSVLPTRYGARSGTRLFMSYGALKNSKHIHTPVDDLESIAYLYFVMLVGRSPPESLLPWMISSSDYDDKCLAFFKFGSFINFADDFDEGQYEYEHLGIDPIHRNVMKRLSAILYPYNRYPRYNSAFGGPETDFGDNSDFTLEVNALYSAISCAFNQKPQALLLDEKDDGIGRLSGRRIRFAKGFFDEDLPNCL